MKVRDIMTRDVLTARLDTPLHEVARLMEQRCARGIPVVDPANRVIGIIPESDLILRSTRLVPPASFNHDVDASGARPSALAP
jgi:CBS domain-containing protein